MNIVYLVASSDISGGQRVVFQQSEVLAEHGHTVTIVCPEPAPTWFPLQKTRWEQAPFAESRTITQADICVATFWTTVMPAATRFRGPLFHLCQGYEADFSFNAPKRQEIEEAYAQRTHKLTVSPHVARRLEALGHRPVTYVGQAFDPSEFPPAMEREFTRNPPTVLLPGIFEAEVKGISEALYAMATLHDSGVSFRLRRISTWHRTEEEINIFNAEDYQVRLTPAEMGAAYRSSDLLIGPSHAEEGFDLPVLESLSSGLPALLSDTPGHRHAAGSAAHYFPCGDAAALAVNAKSLLEDPQQRAELSEKGPLQAARFHTEFVFNRLMDAFTSALIPMTDQ